MRQTTRRIAAEVLVSLTLAVAGCGRVLGYHDADGGAAGDGGGAGSVVRGNAGAGGNAEVSGNAGASGSAGASGDAGSSASAGASGSAGASSSAGKTGSAGTGGATSRGGAGGTGGASIGGTGGGGTGGAIGSGGSGPVDKKPVGASCQVSSECVSAFCVDGVCCNNACTGPCRSCALASSRGTCMPTASGAADPRAICVPPDAVTSCGRTGKCDGAGACQRYPTGTTCAVSSCVGDTFTAAATCDAQGICRVPASVSCAPYGCHPSAGRCNSGCPSGDAICAAGYYCAGDESCFPKKDADVACGSNHECKSGVCVDGMCRQ